MTPARLKEEVFQNAVLGLLRFAHVKEERKAEKILQRGLFNIDGLDMVVDRILLKAAVISRLIRTGNRDHHEVIFLFHFLSFSGAVAFHLGKMNFPYSILQSGPCQTDHYPENASFDQSFLHFSDGQGEEDQAEEDEVAKPPER